MTSVKLPAALEKNMLERIVADGYKFRGKSKWIAEAIEAFLKLPDFYEFVDIAGDMEQLNAVVSVRLPEELTARLDKALIVVRQHYPNMEGVKSNIIRGSIIQRLIRNSVRN